MLKMCGQERKKMARGGALKGRVLVWRLAWVLNSKRAISSDRVWMLTYVPSRWRSLK